MNPQFIHDTVLSQFLNIAVKLHFIAISQSLSLKENFTKSKLQNKIAQQCHH